MIANLVERKYNQIVQAWSVSEFDQVGRNLRFKGKVIFVDDSVLFVRQVVLGETTFKYAYHWQNREGQLIRILRIGLRSSPIRIISTLCRGMKLLLGNHMVAILNRSLKK